MTDSISDCPRISTEARTVAHGHERSADDVPVIEGDDTLTGMIRGNYGSDKMYLVQSQYFQSVAVIAGHEQSALDWLADYGVLDGMLVDEDEARESDRHYTRLGNACQPFDIQQAHIVISEFTVDDIVHFHQRLTFGADGWMHCWSNNEYNDNEPYQDVVFCVGEDFNVIDRLVPKGETLGDEPQKLAQEWAEERIWSLINSHC